MISPVYDINAEQGTKLSLEILYTNDTDIGVDLAIYSKGNMQVRRSTENISTDKILEIDNNTVLTLGVTGSGGITLTSGGITGNILIEVSANTMSSIQSGKYFYDIELVPITGTENLRLVKGRFIVEPEITR